MTIEDDVKTVRDALNYAADGEPDEVAIAAFLRISQALEEREAERDEWKDKATRWHRTMQDGRCVYCKGSLLDGSQPCQHSAHLLGAALSPKDTG